MEPEKPNGGKEHLGSIRDGAVSVVGEGGVSATIQRWIDTYEMFEKFKGLVRKYGQSVGNFIPEFEGCYRDLQNLKPQPMDDILLAMTLLTACDLTYAQTKMVMDVLPDPITYMAMRDTIIGIFGEKTFPRD